MNIGVAEITPVLPILSPEIKELPFVVGVLGDFSAASELEKTKLKDKKFINVDLDNIDEVIESLAPRANFQVSNTLTEAGGKISIDLTFKAMEDFRPENVVQQVDAASFHKAHIFTQVFFGQGLTGAGLGRAAVVLERPNCRHNHRRVRRKAAGPL